MNLSKIIHHFSGIFSKYCTKSKAKPAKHLPPANKGSKSTYSKNKLIPV
jgi:hypothetical protein